MAFDESKPTQNGLLISADHRANFLATRRALASINLLIDPTFEVWNVSDSVAPGTWQHTTGGGTISRDTTLSRLGIGQMGPRLGFGATLNELFQDVIDAASYDQFFDARFVTGGVFVHADTIGIARCRIDDGADVQDSALNVSANPAAPEFLPFEHEVNAAATRLRFSVRLESAGNVTFSGAVFLFSDIRPDRFVWPISLPVNVPFGRPGINAVGALPLEHQPARAFIVRKGQAHVGVAPTGSTEEIELEQSDGAGGFNTMFSGGGILIPDGGQNQGKVVNGTYNRRCFIEFFGSGTPTQGGELRARQVTTGVTTPGENLVVQARGKGWATPAELLLTT